MARAPYADTSKAPPETMTCDLQPYGRFTIAATAWGDYNGFPTLTGRVVLGCERSSLGAHSRIRSIVGEHRTIYGVTQREADERQCLRVAM